MEMALSSALAPDSETQERCSSIEQHSQPASQRCRVLIVDDHAIVREGLKQVIHRDPAFMVSAEAACAAHALQQLRHGGIDIVLMDIALPDRDGIEFLKQIKLLTPSLKVLVCSLYQESAYALRALRAGPAGYVGKQCTLGHCSVRYTKSPTAKNTSATGSRSSWPISCLMTHHFPRTKRCQIASIKLY